MKNWKRIVLCTAVVFAAALAAWRLWPRSIDSFMERPSGEASRVCCSLLRLEFENGKSAMCRYDLIAETDEERQKLQDILSRGRYQASFRSLMPWTWGSDPTGKGYGTTILVTFWYYGDKPEGDIIYFYSGYDSGDYGDVSGRVIYPAGDEMFNELAEYIQDNGEEIWQSKW